MAAKLNVGAHILTEMRKRRPGDNEQQQCMRRRRRRRRQQQQQKLQCPRLPTHLPRHKTARKPQSFGGPEPIGKPKRKHGGRTLPLHWLGQRQNKLLFVLKPMGKQNAVARVQNEMPKRKRDG